MNKPITIPDISYTFFHVILFAISSLFMLLLPFFTLQIIGITGALTCWVFAILCGWSAIKANIGLRSKVELNDQGIIIYCKDKNKVFYPWNIINDGGFQLVMFIDHKFKLYNYGCPFLTFNIQDYHQLKQYKVDPYFIKTKDDFKDFMGIPGGTIYIDCKNVKEAVGKEILELMKEKFGSSRIFKPLASTKTEEEYDKYLRNTITEKVDYAEPK